MKTTRSIFLTALIVSIGLAGTTVRAATAAPLTTMQKTGAVGMGLGLAGVGFVLFGKGLEAWGTVTKNIVNPGVETVKKTGAYQGTIGRFFRKPSTKAPLAESSKELWKNTYILCGMVGVVALRKFINLDDQLAPWLLVGAK